MEKEAETTKENLDPEQIKENHQRFLAELRSKFEITVTREQPMTVIDYITSLGLDPELFDIKKKKKIELDDYVHFFNLERKTDVVEEGTLKWSIRRRASDFFKFEKKINKELMGAAKMSKTDIPQLSSLFNRKEESSPEKFSKAAETYLKQLLESQEIRAKSTALYDFIELCLLPLPVTQTKFKEGYLNKKGGGRFKHNKFKLFISFMFAKCQERWFVLTEDGIMYTIDSSCIKTREILFFDQSFKVEYGKKATGHSSGVALVTPNRRLNLLANDVFEAADWVGDIQKAAKQSPYTKVHRFNSFAPEREAVHNCKWYVDAVGYFEDLYEALSHAKREVFITDWWFTPEIALKRPVQDGESEYRLDKVLGKIANAGVKVYVIVYHEVRMLMYNDSEHVKITLESLSPNITVLKHPSEPFFSWSHHEKMVVVDQTIGFIGGLDLCFGRWDTSVHPLHDPAFEEGTGATYFGQDYANPRLIDFRKVREQPGVSLIDKEATPRMPFHDAMVRVIGPAVADMSRHFIQFWNHVEVDCYNKEEDLPLPKHGLIPALDESSFSKEKMMDSLRNTLKDVFGSRPNFFKTKKDIAKNQLAAGKPISQINESSKTNGKKKKNKRGAPTAAEQNKTKEQNEKSSLEESKEDQDKIELKKQQESDSWFETIQKALASLGATCPARRRKKHDTIEEKAIAIEKSMYMTESASDIDLIQATEKSHTVGQSIKSKINDRMQQHAQHKRERNLSKEEIERINKREILQLLFMPEKDQLKGTVSCQMLRSAAQWSMGLNTHQKIVENSILNSYIQVIQNAKHFVYMESQFFMSGTAGTALKNEISDVLLYRIECAHARQERFRVLVFIPLIHAFEGDVADSKSALLRIQLHWQYMTISRGGHSIYEELRKKDINPEEYIQLYSVRQHHKMQNGVPVTEMIYVHSKILIADDDILVIGSANVNDRSMKGSRDSEIAMYFDDSKKVTSHMNGVEVKVSEFVHTFRKRILAEHLGLSEDEVADPLTDSFIKTMNSRAQRNTEIYREVFAVDPDDNMRTLEGMREFSKKKHLDKYDELAPQIKGHIVMYPLDFLCDENLLPSASAMEYYIADHNFV